MPEVDLSQLAIDRSDTPALATRSPLQLLTRYILPLCLIVGVAALVVWASWDWFFPPRVVTLVPVHQATSNVRAEGTTLFKAAGWVEPRPTPIRVAALAAGVVEELMVVEDQLVKAGTPVAKLVKADAELSHQRAEADQSLRKAELERARATLRAATIKFEHPVHLEAVLSAADADLAKMQTVLNNLPFETTRAIERRDFAERDHLRKLEASGAVPKRMIDQAKSEWVAAAALVDELRVRKSSLENEIQAVQKRQQALKEQLKLLADERRNQEEAAAAVKASEARVVQASVAVAEAKLRLDRMTIFAPVDGRIYQLLGHPGTRTGGNSNHYTQHDGSTVVTMYRPDFLQVRVDVRFDDIPQVILGQAVKIGNPAIDEPLTGHVLFISSEADIQKNTLQVKVEIDDSPALFRPEMLVDVEFLAPEVAAVDESEIREMRLFVQKSLVQQGADGTFIWVADQSQGLAKKRSVTLGSDSGNGMVEVQLGLTIDSKLISSGLDGLVDGDRIKVHRVATPSSVESTANASMSRFSSGSSTE